MGLREHIPSPPPYRVQRYPAPPPGWRLDAVFVGALAYLATTMPVRDDAGRGDDS